MKRLPILHLLLAGCSLIPPVPGLRIEGLSVVVHNPLPVPLTGDPARPGPGPGLVVEGVNIRPDPVAATWCTQDKAPPAGRVRWACNLPDVPGGQQLRVAFQPTAANTAVADAQGFAYTSQSGAVPVPLVPLP